MQMFLTQYVDDTPRRCLSVNISESGLYVHTLMQPTRRPSSVVGLEFELPGTNEVIWAAGTVCYDTLDDYFHGTGIRITAIPTKHARLLRDYLNEVRRQRLKELMERVRLRRRRTAQDAF